MTPITRRLAKNARKTKRQTGGAAHTGQVVSHSLADKMGLSSEHQAATEAIRKVERACDSLLERGNIEARVLAWKTLQMNDPRLKQTIEEANLPEIIAEIMSTPVALTKAIDAAQDGVIFLQSKVLDATAQMAAAVAKIGPLFRRSPPPLSGQTEPSRPASPHSSILSSGRTSPASRNSPLPSFRGIASTPLPPEEDPNTSKNIYNAWGHTYNSIPLSVVNKHERKIRSKPVKELPPLTEEEKELRKTKPIDELHAYGLYPGDFIRRKPK